MPNLPEIIYPPTTGNAIVDLLLAEILVEGQLKPRVDIKTIAGDPITNLNYEISNINAGSVDEFGQVFIWSTATERDIKIRIYILFDSGIDFETFYDIKIMPNIQIVADYSNAVPHNSQAYQEIAFITSYDLITEGNISANTVDPSIDPADDITDTLIFSLIETNDYIKIIDGVLSYTGIPFTEDQYINIRVYTNYDYQITYRVKSIS